MAPLIQLPTSDLFTPLPSGEAQWDDHTIHTHYFGFNIPDEDLGAFIYVRWQPTYRLVSAGVGIYTGSDNLRPLDCEHIDYRVTMPWPEIVDNAFVTANGLRVHFVEPGRVVDVSYESDDGSTSFAVRYTAVTPLLARGHVMPGEDVDGDANQDPGGSEQIMHCVGELDLNGRVQSIDCFAARDRSWNQVRTERDVSHPPVGWSPVYFDDSLSFNQVGVEALDSNPKWLGHIDFPSGRPTHHHAWIIVDGELRDVRSVRRVVTGRHSELFVTTRQELAIEDETGAVHEFQGEAIAVAQLPSWPNNLFFDTVFRWTGPGGRTTYAAYQEVWYHKFQRLMKSEIKVRERV